MEKSSLSKLEKRLRIVFLCLAVIVVAGVLMLVRIQSGSPYITEDSALQDTDETEYQWENGLSDATYWLPDYCDLYEELPEIIFDDADGQTHSISEWTGRNVVLVFWASWCDDCGEQMPKMSDYEALARQYGDFTFLYINKTDGSKETEETAKEYFDGLSLEGTLYYDTSLRAYDKLGLHNIPTTLFLNEAGVVTAWSPKQITEDSVFEAMLKNASEGNSKALAEFITENMMEENGGIHSDYTPGAAVETASEVLSESQGLMLLYAVSVEDENLFRQVWSYTASEMWSGEHLALWKVEDGQAGNVNALIDDFRIYRALAGAEALWGGYAQELKSYGTLLADQAVSDGRYVDFYDFANEKAASRFTLCYGDLQAMELLAQRTDLPELQTAYEAALELIERGQISNEFPLYYSWYDYDYERYENDDLNTAEAMLTLLHLAQEGKLKNNTVTWLKAQMAGEGLKARYTVKGETAKGYNYESTAVYAIVAMIAEEIGDSSLRAQALRKMEKMHIVDMALEYNGAYGSEDGSGITSFDQLMPLLAWRKLEE